MAQEDLIDQVFLKKLNDILDENYDSEAFGVKELAECMHMSRSQLHRKLNAIHGKSTSQIIREFRLEKALKMLQSEVTTASEIAYKVGFNSPTYFNTSFREYYGYPPGEVKYIQPSSPEKSNNIDSFEKLYSQLKIDKLKEIDKNTSTTNKIIIPLIAISLILAFSYFFYTNDSGAIMFNNKEINHKSIAVLPFKNLSNDKENQYFVDGVRDAILNHLTGIKDFKVISGATMEKYRKTKKSASVIAKENGVSYLIDGSVQKHKDSVSVNIQLIDTKTDMQIWSKHFESAYKNIFALESDIAKLIASELTSTLSPIEMKEIETTPTNNLEAYNVFLQAEYQKNKYNKIAFKNALPLYEKAIDLDSNFVDAYIGLSEIWLTSGIVWGLYDEQKAWEETKKSLLKAMSIDPMNKQIKHYLNMGYFYYEWEFELAEKYYQKNRLELTHDKLPPFHVDFAVKTGRYEEALVEIEKYIVNNPSIGYFYTFKAEILMFLGKKDEAIDLLNRSNALYNDKFFYLRESTKLYYYLEAYEASRKQLKNIRNKIPNENPPILIWYDAVFATMDGKKEAAELYLNQLKDRYKTINSGSPAWFIALYYCRIKDYENTFIWLQKSFDRHEVELTWLGEEPILIPLHDDQRYRDLYEKIGFSKIN